MNSKGKQGISVVIPCKNYAHFLGECLQSILGQTHPPDEIILVDDGSEDEPEKVVEKFKSAKIKIIKVDHSSISKSQRDGILYAKNEYICCVDADDTIDPFYLERGIKFLEEDYRIAIVYSDFEYKGLMHGSTSFPATSNIGDIHGTNYIHSASIFKKSVALLTDAFDHPELGNYAVDWYTWRKVLGEGYCAVKQESKYNYRRHEESYSVKRNWNLRTPNYFEIAALAEEKVSICVVVDPAKEAWEEQKKFLYGQTWRRDLVALKILYSGANEDEIKKLRNQVIELPYTDIQFVHCPLLNEVSKTKREYAQLAQISELIDTPFFLFLDEYIRPAHDVIEKLLSGMCENTISVYSNLSNKSSILFSLYKRFIPRLSRSPGLYPVYERPFACVLFRSKQFMELFSSNNVENKDNSFPEIYLYSKFSNGLTAKINCESVANIIFDYKKTPILASRVSRNFDEEFYLENNPDVAKGIEEGIYTSGFEHFILYDGLDSRPFSIQNQNFDEEFYLKHNPDVLEGIKNNVIKSGFEHYRKFGEKEGRRASFC